MEIGPDHLGLFSFKFQAYFSHTGLSLTHITKTERFQKHLSFNRCLTERFLTSRYHTDSVLTHITVKVRDGINKTKVVFLFDIVQKGGGD